MMDEVFTGNTDSETHITNMFEHPIMARAIRIHPATWHSHISMRADALILDN